VIDLAQAKADFHRTEDPIYDSPHCPVPKHRMADYRRALSHMGGLLEELEELRKKVKNG
jgi:hypothetical protein